MIAIITVLLICQITHHVHGDNKRPSSDISLHARETRQQVPPKDAPTLQVPYNLIGYIPLILFVVLGVAVWVWLCPTYGKEYVRFKHSEV